MLPAKGDPRWKSLVTGKTGHSFRSVPAGLMISRVARLTQRDASSEHVSQRIEEVHAFFTKFESILTEDIKAIFG